MPVGNCRIGCWDGTDVPQARCGGNRATALHPMPGLDKWKHETEAKNCPPIREYYTGLTNLEKAREKSGGEGQQRYLGAPKQEVGKPQRHIHWQLRTSLTTSRTLILFPRSCAQFLANLFRGCDAL